MWPFSRLDYSRPTDRVWLYSTAICLLLTPPRTELDSWEEKRGSQFSQCARTRKTYHVHILNLREKKKKKKRWKEKKKKKKKTSTRFIQELKALLCQGSPLNSILSTHLRSFIYVPRIVRILDHTCACITHETQLHHTIRPCVAEEGSQRPHRCRRYTG